MYYVTGIEGGGHETKDRSEKLRDVICGRNTALSGPRACFSVIQNAKYGEG
jgi:hypothetical protein